MLLTCVLGGTPWKVDTSVSHDVSMSVRPLAPAHQQTSAFGLPPATSTDACSVDSGASVNCPIVQGLCAHSCGTHTECVGHALPGRVTLRDIDISKRSGLLPCLLVTVGVDALGDSGDQYPPGSPTDSVIGLRSLQAGLAALASSGAESFSASALGCLTGGALLLRSPSAPFKHLGRWSGTNPPYLTPALVQFALALGVEHLLVDLPSVDKEQDGGSLLSHRAFWGLPPRGEGDPAGPPYCPRTITEMVFVDEAIADGPFLLNLQVAPIELDAAPSRPVLYPLLPV